MMVGLIPLGQGPKSTLYLHVSGSYLQKDLLPSSLIWLIGRFFSLQTVIQGFSSLLAIG